MGKIIKQNIKFKANPHEVYEVLMDSKKHSAFTGSPAKISREVGDRFSCYDGYIKGENIELVKDKKIVQKWIGSDFPKGDSSIVKFELKETKDGGTELHFTHENVPDKLVQDISDGWKEHYWDKMKDYFGE